MKKFLLLVLFFSNLLVTEPRLEFEQSALDDYVHTLDKSYNYQVIKTLSGEGFTTYIVDLTSQTFLTKKDINLIFWACSLLKKSA